MSRKVTNVFSVYHVDGRFVRHWSLEKDVHFLFNSQWTEPLSDDSHLPAEWPLACTCAGCELPRRVSCDRVLVQSCEETISYEYQAHSTRLRVSTPQVLLPLETVFSRICKGIMAGCRLWNLSRVGI